MDHFDISVTYNGVLTSDIRSKIVCDFVKFILYQRQQISSTFEQLQQEVNAAKKLPTKPGSAASRQLKQKMEFLLNVEDLCGQVTQAFSELGPSVHQVLILFGATTVSAKEIYCFHFPTKFFEGKILTAHRCTSRLFRKLIGSDFNHNLGTLACTKLRVFLNAPRDTVAVMEKLEPKLNFSIPGKHAKRLDVHLNCSAPVSSPELSYCEDCSMDISGVDFLLATPKPPTAPLFGNNEPTSAMSQIEDTTASPKESLDDLTSKKKLSSAGDLSEKSQDCGDNIWYHIPVTVTGLKDKIKEGAKKSSESLFMT